MTHTGATRQNIADHPHAVLVVDDEARVRTALVRILELDGIDAHEAEDAATALALFDARSYSLVILDLRMPGRDGFSVLEEILRRNTDQPVLVLSCLSEPAMKVRSLRLGADDYLTKPFHVEELRARVHARLRDLRRQGHATIRGGRLTLDLIGHTANIDGRQTQLSEREFALLHELVNHSGEPVAKEHLLARVWQYPPNQSSNVVDVCVRRLRSRLGDDVIDTVRGQGYRVI